MVVRYELPRDGCRRWRAFSTGKNLGANQIEFVNLNVNHLTEHGVMDARRLYESFTDLAPRGESLFSQASVDELISVLHTARRTATAA